MNKFPSKTYDDQAAYAADYFACLSAAADSVRPEDLRKAADLVEATVKAEGTIFSCGNGGSAAIANHLACDCLKGARTDTDIRPRVHSLSTAVELITAIGNDLAFDDIFSYQLESNARKGDLLIAISSSGASPNILRALTAAKDLGISTIAMVGFDGGSAAKIADVCLWVQALNYGIIEDVHQSLMHLLAQFLRQTRMTDKSLVATQRF